MTSNIPSLSVFYSHLTSKRNNRFVLLSVLICMFFTVTNAQDETFSLERIQRATVFIMQAEGRDLNIRCVGSGTIVRPDGLILTNAHHTVRSTSCPGDTIIIAMTLNINEPPIPKYRAEVVQSDDGLDLALLRITREFDGRLIEETDLPPLPFVSLADSDEAILDETVTFVGYSGIGNDSIDTVRGAVRGFISEPSAGEKSWIKTISTSPISGIMTGGGAYNTLGQLIGIPTTAPLSIDSVGSNCRRIEDTNADGVINDSDACIPLGNPISALRPSNFARTLIRSASLNLRVETLTAPRFDVSPLDRPQITRIFSAPAVVDGNPSTVVGNLPAGTTSHYLFFTYQNMTPQTVYELRVTINGIPDPTFSLPAVRWSGAERGVWYIGSSGQPYPNGDYRFDIFIDGVSAASHSFSISGPALAVPSFSNIVFGLLDTSGNLQGNGYVLPTGATATARFIFQNIPPNTAWTAIWYYNSALVARTDDVWRAENGESGSYSISLQPENGLVPGNYRVELYLGELLSATGDFIIAGAQQGALPTVFSNIEFLRATGLQPPTGNPASTFPDGANTLYMRFDWQQIALGTQWKFQWLVDENIFYEQVGPWTSPESGSRFTLRLTAPTGIPDGSYRVRLYINNILLSTSVASIGIGQLAIDRFSQTTGVQLRGKVVDAETQLGIEGVTFIVISEDFAVNEFVWDESQVVALAITDRNGNFEIDRLLAYLTPYSILIISKGYLPLSADGFEFTEDRGSLLEMFIPMTRD